MAVKPTLFCVFDTETTKPTYGSGSKGLVFDMGWETIDRKGNSYGTGSYFATDVVEMELPYYLHKIAGYVDDAYHRKVIPVKFIEMRKEFLSHIGALRLAGHRVILCAYNAAFDTRVLRETALRMGFDSFLDFKYDVLCIWRYWAETAPKMYGLSCPYSDKGNPKTDCESVARYELDIPEYVHAHTAFSDVSTEKAVLLKALARHGKMPINDFSKQAWKIAKERIHLRDSEIGRKLLVPTNYEPVAA